VKIGEIRAIGLQWPFRTNGLVIQLRKFKPKYDSCVLIGEHHSITDGAAQPGRRVSFILHVCDAEVWSC
jgi:hypothetical protein